MVRSAPAEINTGCGPLDALWSRYAAAILDRPGILILDTEEDLNWHAFLGHSLDMQGFRAAEFVGVDPLTRQASGFVALRERGIGVRELADLWAVAPIQSHLFTGVRGTPLTTSLEVLRAHGGEKGVSLAEAFAAFPWRKFHWSVRALLQNSAVLADHGYSFREWLRHECGSLGVTEFPPADFRVPVPTTRADRSLERALRERLEQTFYMVGPALSAYMICDWQLSLWHTGATDVFAAFKLDSFHTTFVEKYGAGGVPTDEDGFADWWFARQPDLPPRLANECIWLGMEQGAV